MQALVERSPAWLRFLIAFTAATLFLLWLHWDGLNCWFFQDDFAWLGLLRQVHNGRGVLNILFDPAAQGTIRPLSERGYFLLFEYLFGLDALPFRIAVFVTMAINLGLVIWIVRRLTGSVLAGVAASMVWLSNAAMMTVMTWSSAFNEALCPCFLLAALVLFIRYAGTGKRFFWWWQLVVFIIGFGVLESNIVHPALAAAWVLFAEKPDRRRALLRSLIVPFIISVGYFAMHRMLAPIPKSGPYAIHFDPRIFQTLGLYAAWSIVPADFTNFGYSHLLAVVLYVVCGSAIAAAAVAELKARRRTVLFFAAWFIITLAPVLPLPDHHTEYYLTMPLIGPGMFAGYCLFRWPALAAVPVIVYLAASIPVARDADAWALGRSTAVRTAVEGVREAHVRHPNSVILLDGISTDLYNAGLGDSPFYSLGIDHVYLTPGSEANMGPVPDPDHLRDVVLEPSVLLRELRKGNAVIYSISGDHLRNVTKAYERSAPNLLINGLPARVDVGNALFSHLLGPEWLPAETGFRWMAARATLKLRGPGINGGNLTIDGYCPAGQLRQAPKRLWVTADGLPVGDTKVNDPETNFHRLFPLPPATWGRASIEIELRADPLVHEGGRDLGLVFGKIAVESKN